MTQRIYLDTGILVPVLWSRDTELEPVSRGIITDLRGEVKTHDKCVCIPKLCVGEAVGKYIEDLRGGHIPEHERPPEDAFTDEFYDLIERLDAELVSVKTEVKDVANQLFREDSGRTLKHNDLMIASTAVADVDSTHLISHDRDLIECRAIARVAERLEDRNYGFTVSNEYR